MFKPVEKSLKVYEHIMEQIKILIANGTLKKGDKLPSERALAEKFQVSRTSVREAFKALQVLGLIDSKQGGGNYITNDVDNALIETLSIMFMLRQNQPKEILELRSTLETGIARLAAEKIEKEELISLSHIIYEMENCEDAEEDSILDRKFHHTLATASKNFFILCIWKSVFHIIDSFIAQAREDIVIHEENKEILLDQHKQIFDAIKNNDPQKSSDTMQKHLTFVNDYMMRN